MPLTPNESSKLPWYRRPLPPHFPAWLVISIFTAIVGGLFASWTADPDVISVLIGVSLGFFGGLVFSLMLAGRFERHETKGIPQFHPPNWLAVPVLSAVMTLLAYSLIDETLRQGYYSWYRRNRYYHIPGPFAIIVACFFLISVGSLSAAAIWRKERSRSWFIGGVLGFAVLGIGVLFILIRVALKI